MKKLKTCYFFFILFIYLNIVRTKSDYILDPIEAELYGLKGNSTYVNKSDSDAEINSTINLPKMNCIEDFSLKDCIINPTCCHVTSSNQAFVYSACIDVQTVNKTEHEIFCKKFYKGNADNNFKASQCECFDFVLNKSSYLKSNISLIIILILKILMI